MTAQTRFEVIPVPSVDAQLGTIPRRATVTVTSSPRFGIERTIEYVARLADLERDLNVVPHLAARQILDSPNLDATLRRLTALGVREIFVVGGDDVRPAGEFESAGDLLERMADTVHGIERIGIAGYPEGHPFVSDEVLTVELLRKQARSDYIVSQICFDPPAICAWIERLRAEGVTLPIYVGVPGVVRRTRLLELSFRLGVGRSLRHLSKQRALGDRLLRRATFRPDHLVQAITEHIAPSGSGVAGLHYFTFNEVASTLRWLTQRSDRDDRARGRAQ